MGDTGEGEMDEKYRAKGIAQIKTMFSRWEDEDGEFRNYVARRVDTLKMVGAGNASGLIAIAAYLTAGTRQGLFAFVAKLLILIFSIGTGAFILAFRNLYHLELDVEDGLLLLRGGKEVDDTKVENRAEKVLDRSEKSGALVAIAFGCLLLGGLGCCIALLLI
jgi:hypothetical protein